MPDAPSKCEKGYTMINGECVRNPTPPPPSFTSEDNKSEDEKKDKSEDED